MARKKHDPNDESSQKKILDAAEQIFADKGYYGARVSEIGKAAGVNPALLYYYFDNKEDILHKLLANAIEETSRLLDDLFKDIEGPESINELSLDHILENIVDFFFKKESILKIMLVEMMNAGQTENFFFDFVTPLFDKVESKKQAMKVFKKDQASFRTHMFLCLTAPLFFHITMGKNWSKYTGIDMKYSRDMLKQAIQKMMLNDVFVLELK